MKQLIKTSWLGISLVTLAIGSVGIRIIRTSTAQVTDLSDGWNDTYSRLVAEKMLEELTEGLWLTRFKQKHLTKIQRVQPDEKHGGVHKTGP